MPTFKVYRSYLQYERATIEADNEDEARDIANDGDCDWNTTDSDDYEVGDIEQISDDPPASTDREETISISASEILRYYGSELRRRPTIHIIDNAERAQREKEETTMEDEDF